MSAVGAGEALQWATIPVPPGVAGRQPIIVAMLPESFWPQYGRPVATYADNTIRDQNGTVVRDLAPAPLSFGGGLTWRDFARYPDGSPVPGPAGGILASPGLDAQTRSVLTATLAAGVEKGFAAPTAVPWYTFNDTLNPLNPNNGKIVYSDGSIRTTTGAVLLPAGTLMPRDAGQVLPYNTTLPTTSPAGVAVVLQRSPEVTGDPSSGGARTPTADYGVAPVVMAAADPANGPNVAGAGVVLTGAPPALSLSGDGITPGYTPPTDVMGAPAVEPEAPTGLGGVPWWAIGLGVLAVLVAMRGGR